MASIRLYQMDLGAERTSFPTTRGNCYPKHRCSFAATGGVSPEVPSNRAFRSARPPSGPERRRRTSVGGALFRNALSIRRKRGAPTRTGTDDRKRCGMLSSGNTSSTCIVRILFSRLVIIKRLQFRSELENNAYKTARSKINLNAASFDGLGAGDALTSG